MTDSLSDSIQNKGQVPNSRGGVEAPVAAGVRYSISTESVKVVGQGSGYTGHEVYMNQVFGYTYVRCGNGYEVKVMPRARYAYQTKGDRFAEWNKTGQSHRCSMFMPDEKDLQDRQGHGTLYSPLIQAMQDVPAKQFNHKLLELWNQWMMYEPFYQASILPVEGFEWFVSCGKGEDAIYEKNRKAWATSGNIVSTVNVARMCAAMITGELPKVSRVQIPNADLTIFDRMFIRCFSRVDNRPDWCPICNGILYGWYEHNGYVCTDYDRGTTQRNETLSRPGIPVGFKKRSYWEDHDEVESPIGTSGFTYRHFEADHPHWNELCLDTLYPMKNPLTDDICQVPAFVIELYVRAAKAAYAIYGANKHGGPNSMLNCRYDTLLFGNDTELLRLIELLPMSSPVGKLARRLYRVYRYIVFSMSLPKVWLSFLDKDSKSYVELGPSGSDTDLYMTLIKCCIINYPVISKAGVSIVPINGRSTIMRSVYDAFKPKNPWLIIVEEEGDPLPC